ncbi:LuxR C-terminal-related transcriptional regulator [Streptomonospora litoralis]
MRESIVPAPVPVPEGGKHLPVSLSDDELQLLAEIATGVTTDVAARRLELSARTLRRRLRGICDELGVNTPIEAVVWAARKQLI